MITLTDRVGIKNDVSADFHRAIAQRTRIFEELREAEKEARETLLALTIVQEQADREAKAFDACLDLAMTKCGKHVVISLIEAAQDSSDMDWEREWDYKWINPGGQERDAHGLGYVGDDAESKDETVPVNEEVSTDSPPPGSGSSHDESVAVARALEIALAFEPVPAPALVIEAAPEPEPSLHTCPSLSQQYGWGPPSGFTDSFGPTTLVPRQSGPSRGIQVKRQTRRLQREYMRIHVPDNGTEPVLVDTRAAMEAHRQTTRNKVEAHKPERQALLNDLWAINRPSGNLSSQINWDTYEQDFGAVPGSVPSRAREGVNPFALPRTPIIFT